MRLSFGQELRQVQKQILAPRMIQSMEILQLPILALQERIEQEMEENPVLEMSEEVPDLPADAIYALHCCWELEVNKDPRAPETRSIEAGRQLLNL